MLKNAACLLAAALAVAFFLSRPAYAHYLWVAQEGDRYVIARGTPPNEQEAYNPEAVTLIKVFDQQGNEVSIERENEKAGVFFKAQHAPAIAAVSCEWGSRVKTTRGKKLMTRKEAEAQGFRVLEAFTSTQTSKTLFEDGDAVCKNLGMRFEIIPLKSPFQLRPGTPLEVQIIFDGEALHDAVVLSSGQAQAKTDQAGTARIGALAEGWNIIMTRHTVSAVGDSEIDYHQFMTFLVFKVR